MNEEERALLAEALPHEGYCELWMKRGKACQCAHRKRNLEALLPAVDRIAAARAAEELEAAAVAIRSAGGASYYSAGIVEDRAAALRDN